MRTVALLTAFTLIALVSWVVTGNVSTLDAVLIALASFTIGWIARNFYTEGK